MKQEIYICSKFLASLLILVDKKSFTATDEKKAVCATLVAFIEKSLIVKLALRKMINVSN